MAAAEEDRVFDVHYATLGFWFPILTYSETGGLGGRAEDGCAELVSPASKPHQGSATMYSLYVLYTNQSNWDLEQVVLNVSMNIIPVYNVAERKHCFLNAWAMKWP